MSDSDLNYYKNLRIFKEKSTAELVNLFMLNKLLHYSIFVNNADFLYKLSAKILGNQSHRDYYL